jgi:hypothetical protein
MNSLLDPAVLFFAFGVLAGVLRSDLEIPPQVSKFLSLYLLMALGLKGGFALAASGWTADAVAAVGAALAMAALVPALGYAVLHRHVSRFDAAAVAASYGSVSAVTFVTAMQVLETQGMAFGGHMTVAMVLMESPAILMAVLLANWLRRSAQAGPPAADAADRPATGSLRKVLHESLTSGSHLLLLGAMVIGFSTGETGQATMKPFAGDLFKGMLAFFLLDMGLMVARNFSAARAQSGVLIAYAALAPAVHAAIALGLALLLDLPAGDATLLMVLSASASYIVVPAVLRQAIPEANATLYVGLPLAITFPVNILVGIPLYAAAASHLLGT